MTTRLKGITAEGRDQGCHTIQGTMAVGTTCDEPSGYSLHSFHFVGFSSGEGTRPAAVLDQGAYHAVM